MSFGMVLLNVPKGGFYEIGKVGIESTWGFFILSLVAPPIVREMAAVYVQNPPI